MVCGTHPPEIESYWLRMVDGRYRVYITYMYNNIRVFICFLFRVRININIRRKYVWVYVFMSVCCARMFVCESRFIEFVVVGFFLGRACLLPMYMLVIVWFLLVFILIIIVLTWFLHYSHSLFFVTVGFAVFVIDSPDLGTNLATIATILSVSVLCVLLEYIRV